MHVASSRRSEREQRRLQEAPHRCAAMVDPFVSRVFPSCTFRGTRASSSTKICRVALFVSEASQTDPTEQLKSVVSDRPGLSKFETTHTSYPTTS